MLFSRACTRCQARACSSLIRSASAASASGDPAARLSGSLLQQRMMMSLPASTSLRTSISRSRHAPWHVWPKVDAHTFTIIVHLKPHRLKDVPVCTRCLLHAPSLSVAGYCSMHDFGGAPRVNCQVGAALVMRPSRCRSRPAGGAHAVPQEVVPKRHFFAVQPIRTWDHLGFSFLSFNLFLAYPTQEHRTIIHLRIGELHVTTRLHHGSQAWGWQDHNVRPTAESTEVLAPPPPPLTHRQLATGTTSHMPPRIQWALSLPAMRKPRRP